MRRRRRPSLAAWSLAAAGLCGLCLAGILLTACAAPGLPSAAPTLTVFAAASLTDAFVEIGHAFESERPGVKVIFNFGGSQALRTQLEQGARADVFASANQKEMDAAVAAALVAEASPRVFAANHLVVILPEDNPGRVQSLADLARPGLLLVMAAEAVPVGAYSREALRRLEADFGAGFAEGVLANVVSSEDNVRQVVTKVQLGEADAGLVYGSDAVAVPSLQTLAIPAARNITAAYPIAVLASAPYPDLAAAFVDYVLSPAGQAALQKWGFESPRP